MAFKQRGRPPILSADDKDLLLEAIESGQSIRNACRSLGVETSTFYLTLNREPDFMERYDAAKLSAVDAHVHEAEDAARDAMEAETGARVAGIKVFVDHKWKMASRIAPARWGEKSSVHVTGQISDDPAEMAKRVAFLEALGGSQEPDDETGPEVAPEA
jgi:hypothetical protein